MRGNHLPPEQDAAIRRLLLAGHSDTHVGARLGHNNGVIRRRRKELGLPSFANGAPVQFSPALKRKAMRLARSHGTPYASAQTGLSSRYINYLKSPSCRVKGFEGRRYLRELADAAA